MSCHSTRRCQYRVTSSAQQMPDPKASDLTWRRSVWWGKAISQLLLHLNVEDVFPFPHFLLGHCTTSSLPVAAFPRGFLLSLISFTVCTTWDQAPLSTKMPFQTLLLTWVPVSSLPYSKRINSNPLPETGNVFDKQCLPAVRNLVPRRAFLALLEQTPTVM